MKKLISFLAFILPLVFLYQFVFGATYYVDCNADGDAGAGTSTAANVAWKTIAKVNGSSFSAGDSVLFNKGCTWREQLTVPSSGGAGSVITFGAYGGGTNPVIWAIWANAKNYLTFDSLLVPGEFILDGTNATVQKTQHGDGVSCWNFGTTGSSVDFDHSGGSGTILWSWSDGSTSTSADPADKDLVSSAKRYHSVCMQTPAGKTISSSAGHITGDIGQFPSGLTGSVNFWATAALTGNIGQLPSGLIGSVNFWSAAALTGDIGQLPSGLTGYVDLGAATALTGDIGQLPSGLTGDVSIWSATALSGNIGQFPSGLTGSVDLGAATALTGDIGQFPSGLTGYVNLWSVAALTGNIGQLPSGLTGNVNFWSAAALTYTSASWPMNTGNSKTLTFAAANQANMTQVMVDDLLCDADAKANTGCTLDIGSASTPSVAGATCKTALQAKGWTVTTRP